jgi:hypothetical protein
MKLEIVLVSGDGSTAYGTAVIEADPFFTQTGAVLWENRYFKAEFAYGPAPEPFPVYEQNGAIVLSPGDVTAA